MVSKKQLIAENAELKRQLRNERAKNDRAKAQWQTAQTLSKQVFGNKTFSGMLTKTQFMGMSGIQRAKLIRTMNEKTFAVEKTARLLADTKWQANEESPQAIKANQVANTLEHFHGQYTDSQAKALTKINVDTRESNDLLSDATTHFSEAENYTTDDSEITKNPLDIFNKILKAKAKKNPKTRKRAISKAQKQQEKSEAKKNANLLKNSVKFTGDIPF